MTASGTGLLQFSQQARVGESHPQIHENQILSLREYESQGVWLREQMQNRT